ncbi:MAG: DUF2760 domain-containing protein [Planctomycetaceae bacterium]
MGRISLAWRVLTSGAFAAQVTTLLEAAPALAAPVSPAAPQKPVTPPKPAAPLKPLRREAVTLLAAFQREGRLIDFLKEPIEAYSDAQVGAAVRDIHRDCGGMLERQFAIRPVLDQAEGSNVTIGADAKNGRIKLTGNMGDGTQASGMLVHHGWLVTKVMSRCGPVMRQPRRSSHLLKWKR